MFVLIRCKFHATDRIWLGLTDNNETNGSTLNKDTNTTEAIEINANKGDWKWLSGDDVAGYSNWENFEPNATDFILLCYGQIQADG